MFIEIKAADYPRLMEIWESAVINTHDFLKDMLLGVFAASSG